MSVHLEFVKYMSACTLYHSHPHISTTFADPEQRHKIVHAKPTLEQQIAGVSPTLTPFQPEPMASPPPTIATTDELAFFDRVKKFIGNKQTYNEFLKLLNLFSQGLMDKAVLYDKVRNFIGGNKELLEWFKKFIQWDGVYEEILHTPQLMNKVRLSVCRALGPSYRLLPKLVCLPNPSLPIPNL